MRPGRLLAALLWLALSGGAALAQQPGPPGGAQPAVPTLNVGDAAPAFALTGSDGTTYRLADFRGVKPVVLTWFPRAPIKD